MEFLLLVLLLCKKNDVFNSGAKLVHDLHRGRGVRLAEGTYSHAHALEHLIKSSFGTTGACIALIEHLRAISNLTFLAVPRD
jgi:hypothetical protein